MRPTGLDESATRLAIPQPDGLVVVDLTTGSAERYDVPGLQSYAIWHDAAHVLVAHRDLGTGTVVDLPPGVSSRRVRPSTRVPGRRLGA